MGYLHMRINELIETAGISKNRVCKDLDIPRANFNRYCRDEFQRIDAIWSVSCVNTFNVKYKTS